jgi:twitching motility two-component system response regulator PilG
MQREPFDQRLIVADNDSAMRGILRSVLDHPRRALFLAANGLEAVEFAQRTPADLVLLDMRMPQLDGLEACARIREIPRYQDIPIVILTAFDGEVARRKARRLGATAFFIKPFTTDSLLRSLAPLIEVGSQVTRRYHVAN